MKRSLLEFAAEIAVFELTWKATHKLLRRLGW